MSELNEQQTHLASLINQRDKLAAELENLKVNAAGTRDLFMKVFGAIEYLTQTGVKIPEPVEETDVEETEESTEKVD